TLLHALGKAQEDIGDYADAYATFLEAARLERAAYPWNRAAFATSLTALRDALRTGDAPLDPTLGSEVVFIVGMPRSGSTLVEQILAAHPLVEGGSELPDLAMTIGAESARRGTPFPQWASEATTADWHRLGRDYLARTSRWRVNKPHFTDKFPGNWIMAQAVLTMLPGARIIDCRRDPLEVCWSCFKQFFAPGKAAWNHAFDDLADYWRQCTRHGDMLAVAEPNRFRIQAYESLCEDTHAQIRELLAFCGLDFDAACLHFDQADRVVRTASAAQVRQPITRSNTAAEKYGTLLDPLRDALRKTAASDDADAAT
ncbi:MAG: sulfotransferase, partial [Rudaea sp.]